MNRVVLALVFLAIAMSASLTMEEPQSALTFRKLLEEEKEAKEVTVVVTVPQGLSVLKYNALLLVNKNARSVNKATFKQAKLLKKTDKIGGKKLKAQAKLVKKNLKREKKLLKKARKRSKKAMGTMGEEERYRIYDYADYLYFYDF